MAILKIARFWPAFERSPQSGLPKPVALDGLDAFGSEAAPIVPIAPSPLPVPKPARPAKTALSTRVMVWGVVALLVAAAAGGYAYQRRVLAGPPTGILTVETSPADLEVVIQGKVFGRTPLNVPLKVGSYDVQVGTGAQQRVLKVNVASGVASVQHVEFVAAQPALQSETATLRVQTEPSKLAVLVDGVDRGWSPLTIERLTPGDHDVAVRTERGAVHRSVKLQASETLALLVSAAAVPDVAAATGGWLTVSAPIALQLREGGKVIGTSESEKVMMTAGDHDVEIVNEALGFRATRKVRIAAGKVATTRIDLPNGSLSVNAQPWAEVWIDGERVGETPIGNLQRSIGTHQVIFRHPELGERRESVLITLLQPARLGVDLRKK